MKRIAPYVNLRIRADLHRLPPNPPDKRPVPPVDETSGQARGRVLTSRFMTSAHTATALPPLAERFILLLGFSAPK